MISFKTSKEEQRTIHRIADRATALALSEVEIPTVDMAMDITAVHANGCRLRLTEMLSAEPFDFMHDIIGIRVNLNRSTGKLENHFLPRFAK